MTVSPSIPLFADQDYTVTPFKEMPAVYIACIVFLLLPLPAAAIRFSTFEENLPKILLSTFAYAAMLCAVLLCIIRFSPLKWIWCICAAGFAGTLIYKGLDEMKLMPANLGLLMLFVQIGCLLKNFDLSPLVIGIIFLLFGVALIVLNYEMHTRKREAAALALAEKQAEEDAE